MPTTAYSDLIRSLSDLFGVRAALLTTLLFALLIAFTCWRTRSTHLVVVRLWRLVTGKSDLSDRELGRMLDTRHKLLKFRFHTGLAARTWLKAKELMSWAARHDEELADVKTCGHWFDLEATRLKEQVPAAWGLFWRVLTLTLAAWLAMLLLSLTASNRAFLQMRESGTFFSLSIESANGVFRGQRITVADCTADEGMVAQKLSVTLREAKSVCDALRDAPATRTLVGNAVTEQRLVFGFLSGLVALFTVMALLAVRRLVAAQEMRKRQTAPARQATQSEEQPQDAAAQMEDEQAIPFPTPLSA
jgi:hypothetical protein